MNRLSSPILTFLSLAAFVSLAHAAPPRFAVVKVTDIYRSLPSTLAFQKQIKEDQEAILKNERAEQLRKIIAELQEIQKQYQDKSKPRDEAETTKLARSFEIKRQEAQTLQQEFEAYRGEQQKIINRKIVTSMHASLDKISAASQKIAKEKGYDGLFDSSGDSNSTVPVLLYAKDAPDISEDVKKALGEGPAPAPEKP